MNILEYASLSKRTCPELGSRGKNLMHMRLGVITEFGELFDVFKKNLAYSKEIDWINVQEELSDVMWYLVNEARFTGSPLQDLKEANDGDFNTEECLSLLIGTLTKYLEDDFPTMSIIGNLRTISFNLQLDFFQGLENNINKLRIRFPEKFDTEKALNRDLDNERKELER